MHNVLALRSARTSSIDLLREEHAGALTQVLAIVSFALMTAVGANLRVYLWEVPVTMQTAAVYASGLYLGWRNGMLAQLLYLAAGMMLPVFAGEGAGAAYVLGAVTGGYLLAYPVAAAVAGYLSRTWNSLAGATVSSFVSAMVLFTIGVIWLHFAADHATWMESIDKGFLRFIPIDAAKIMLVGLLYAGTRRLS